jgi:D-alanine-D-alanine ligase
MAAEACSSVVSIQRVGILSNEVFGPSRGEDVDYVSEAEVEEQADAVQGALAKLGFDYRRFILGEDIEGFVRELKEYRPDVVINLCEAVFGDSHLEMDVPGILELLRVPYTGSPPLSLGLCQDKGLTKYLLMASGIPTPRFQVLEALEDWRGGLSYPLFVKPLWEDASLGITKESYITKHEELEKRVEYIVHRYRQPALVEEYIGGRELNVAILGDKEPEALPVSEIVFEFSGEPKIVNYSAKWLKDSEEYAKTVPVCPARLKAGEKHRVEQTALQAYGVLHCRDYARIDIRLRQGISYVLEANPNPDISPDAGFARSLKTAGISYEGFIRRIISYALERGRIRADR